MVYTLATNAISSLSIAIEFFKKFFYNGEEYSLSEENEAIKICITFLENALELLMKTILVESDPLSIYECPQSKAIQNALGRVTESTRLENILVSEGNFKTIKYSEAVKRYNASFHNSDKVFHVLTKLGEVRNAITHFGISRINSKNELIIDIINAFDIIYNYLCPQLIEIESIQHFFTSDDWFVETIHGVKPLWNEEFIYNNIIDFLDELMESSEEYALSCRLSDPASRINEFVELMTIVLDDRKFQELLKRNNAEIVFHNTCDIAANNYFFDILLNGDFFDSVYSCYSRFFNVTAFCNECGAIFFLVAHDKNELYLYGNNSDSIWPSWSEPEPDMLWINDFENGLCQKMNLSKRNILKAFDAIT